MRLRLIVGLLFALAGLTGCESFHDVPTRVRQRFEPAQPQVRNYEAAPRAVFDAAQRAMKRIDFRVVRAGAAQGTLSSISRIQPGGSFGTGRQYAMEVKLRELEPKLTEVAVVLREQEESNSFAGATDIALRDHGLYTSFFEAVAQELAPETRTPATTAPTK